jgi:hypothetical protein
MPVDGPSARSSGARWWVLLWVVALAFVGTSLAVRVIHRGPYVPGWDILGAAQGLYLVETKTPAEILAFHRENVFHPTNVWNVHAAPVVTLPGLLASWWPWEYWNHVVTFTIVLVILTLTAAAVGASWREAPIVVLAWGASSTLLSQSVVGFAYVTGFLPYAIALYAVLRLRARPWSTLMMAALAIAFAWQGQELGRTVFAVFLVATVTVAGASWSTRAVWLAAGAWQLRETLLHLHYNTTRWKLIVPTFADVVTVVPELLRHALIRPQVELASFVALGLVCLLLVRRNRWLWWSLAALHGGLIGLLALNAVEFVWPRRIVVFLFLLLAAIVSVYVERGRTIRRVLLAALVVANVAQFANVVAWSRTPIVDPTRDWGFTLPHVWTSVENMVPYLDVEWYEDMRARVDRGERLLLLYNLSAYEENYTNPSGVIERLYLHLGHARFVSNVFVFGSVRCRWVCLPIRPLSEVSDFVAALQDPSSITGFKFTNEVDAEAYRQEIDGIERALESRFAIDYVEPWHVSNGKTERYAAFKLVPKLGTGAAS